MPSILVNTFRIGLLRLSIGLRWLSAVCTYKATASTAVAAISHLERF